MDNAKTVRAAFEDELKKIAGTGMVRFGRTPMRASTAAAQTGRAARGLGKFFKKAAIDSKHLPKIVGGSMVTGGALTVYGQKKLKKLKQDYEINKAMRQAGG